MMHSHFTPAWLFWDPERIAFTLPFVGHPIAWYGIWFVIGFIFAYVCLIPMFQRKLLSKKRDDALFILDRLTWLIVLGTIVGARLGHVFFYDWPYYSEHLPEIFKVWNGGLASHGGTIGVIIALLIFRFTYRLKFPEITFISLLDMIAVPTAFTACCIRMGNFFNQEILGIESTLPWAIVFGSPADGSSVVPRHPVQLYEGLAYLTIFFFLTYLWIKKPLIRPGMLVGLFFIFIFSSRFFLEFLKLPQTIEDTNVILQTGQLLSLPFIAFGFGLIYFGPKLEQQNVKA
jgi:phosphatidylglycerol:prolipoprotein diacylglycerol transferase